MSLTTVLTSLRTTLKTLSVGVHLRDELPVNASNEYEFPTGDRFIILDLVATEAVPGLSGSIYNHIDVQVGIWSRVGITNALALAESARAAIEDDWSITGAIALPRDGEYRGVLFRVTQEAAFDTI